MPGRFRWRTVCSDSGNSQLHGVEGTIEAAPYQGANPIYRRGPVRISTNRRYLETQDGTPFFWLADTWWMALVKRLGFPDDFARLSEDRAAKGFNVVQLVAGLYPDMDSFDPRAPPRCEAETSPASLGARTMPPSIPRIGIWRISASAIWCSLA